MESHKRTPWQALNVDEVLTKLHTTREGLSDAEAAERLRTHGPNELRRRPPRTLWQMLWGQLTDVMVLILIGAAILSFLLNEQAEGWVILLIVVVNAVIGVAQEKKAQTSLEALRKLSAPTARALRQGEESVIPARELVPGDIVLLEDGALVPADLRLLESSSLKLQESALTGESVPVEKDADALASADCPLGDRLNLAYASAIVLHGRGVGVVTATGMETEVGQIARMLEEQDDDFDTPLKRKLNAVGKTLSGVGLVICVLIFGLGMIYGRPWLPLLMTAISLAISIIPEGLPATATIVMALGVQRMARRYALIRKLPAVETLGGATVICCDKTGTLTLNRMTVTALAAGDDLVTGSSRRPEAVLDRADYRELAITGALCNDAAFDPDHEGMILGDPTEGALLFLGRTFGFDPEALERERPRVYEQPFDSDRKRMSTLHREDKALVVRTKGAVESLLARCRYLVTGSGVRELTAAERQAIQELTLKLSAEGLRVLGVARGQADSVPEDEHVDLERNLTFLGLVGLSDPPRREVAAAIRTCRGAGIRTVMITGDHPSTAQAIARELGLWREGDRVVTGTELEQVDDAELDRLVTRNTTVFARVSPRDKLRIVRSLKRQGEIAAMTGDGVNDAPALKAADIGTAMGVGGTEVARDAADMVLLDDNFSTIVAAVEEGRRVYRNLQKVIQFLLGGNVSEILVLFLATALNWNPPLLAIHILWINLATDTWPALALGVDPADRDIMKFRPVRSGTLFEPALVRRVIFHGVLIALATLIAFQYGMRHDSYAAGQTMAFLTLALAQLWHAFNQRSNLNSIFSRNCAVNYALLAALGVSLTLLAALIWIPGARSAFRLVQPTAAELGMVLLLSLLPVAGVELFKLIRRWSGARRGRGGEF